MDRTPTFGELEPVIRYACKVRGIYLHDSDTVERVAARILRTIGYHPADAKSNAHTLALMVYEAPKWDTIKPS